MNEFQYLEKMKQIHDNLLLFLQDSANYEENYQNIANIFHDQKILDNKQEFKSFLHIISKISNNHQRGNSFFGKIEQILQNFKTDIKKYFTNSEIFNIFKSNKRILLFLLEEEIIKMDECIVKTIITDKYLKYKYPEYFQPEIKPFIKEKWFPKSVHDEYNWELMPENFYEKRKIGENDDFVCQLIQKDSIDEFINYIDKNIEKTNSIIQPSIYETNPFLLKNEKTTLIEYAAFFGSIQIIQYLAIIGIELTQSLWIYSIHNQNVNLIQLLEENNIMPNDKTLYEIIKCHHNDIINYIKKYLENDEENSFDTFIQCLKYYNFIFITENHINNSSSFSYLCKYDYYQLVEILLKNMDINQTISFI